MVFRDENRYTSPLFSVKNKGIRNLDYFDYLLPPTYRKTGKKKKCQKNRKRLIRKPRSIKKKKMFFLLFLCYGK
ncbi:MAG TPA: hypothetical protein DDW18_04570 [Firmicutes bacterium]|nr:hypothetical protein [Bacillota bacterium]